MLKRCGWRRLAHPIEPIWSLSERSKTEKMKYTSSLTDKEWDIIEPLLPQKKRTRPPKWSKREILDAILYQLKI
ncbi:MAG: transposase [Microcoleaceae cyanobacterium]